jgi:hypothetical protein
MVTSAGSHFLGRPVGASSHNYVNYPAEIVSPQ